jgi:uncharacterized membrane protein YphA (DoxX/SURF4 family)
MTEAAMKREPLSADFCIRLKSVKAAPRQTLAAAAIRALIGAVFFTSGLLKMVNNDKFIESLTTYEIFSTEVIELAALTLPHAELICGVLFAFGFQTKVLGAILIGQLIIFSSIALLAFVRGGAVDCGCFPLTGASEPVGGSFFLRNGLLIILCFWTAFGLERSKCEPTREP